MYKKIFLSDHSKHELSLQDVFRQVEFLVEMTALVVVALLVEGPLVEIRYPVRVVGLVVPTDVVAVTAVCQLKNLEFFNGKCEYLEFYDSRMQFRTFSNGNLRAMAASSKENVVCKGG